MVRAPPRPIARFPDEWFVQPGDAPDLDMVGVRQVEAGVRRRSPFEIPVSPCAEPVREAAATEAGAHALFDLTQQRESAVSCAEVEASISRYAQSYSA
jgi:hypothetical protein